MPHQEEVWETYWTVCRWWIFRYLCLRARRVWKWCYFFDTIHGHEFFVYGWYYGCEAGTEYYWNTGPFVGIGSGWSYNKRKCFGNKLEVTGECVDRPAPSSGYQSQQYLRVAGGYTTLIGAVTMIVTQLLVPLAQVESMWCPWLPLFVLLASLITLYWTGKVGGILALILLILYFLVCGPGLVIGLIVALVGAILSIADS